MYQVNFLPWRMARQQARYRFWRNILLCQCMFLALGLMAVLMWLRTGQIQRQDMATALAQQRVVLSQQQQQVQQTLARLQRIDRQFQLHYQARQPARNYSQLLQQLSQHIPDSCWLMALRQQGDELLFEVNSQDYTAIHAFLAMLGRQSVLANASLQGITQQEGGDFRFVVHADWRSDRDHDEEHHGGEHHE